MNGMNRNIAITVIIIIIIMTASCAGLQKTSEEPIHAEKGTGITIWKIPVLGIGSWGKEEEKISYSFQENNHLYTVTAIVINDNDHVVYSLIYDGYYSKEQLILVTNEKLIFKVKPFSEVVVPERFDRTRPQRKYISNLLPNHQYSNLDFHLIGKKIIAITSNTFATISDNSSSYHFRGRYYYAAAVITLPTISRHIQPLRFEFDFDLKKIISSLF